MTPMPHPAPTPVPLPKAYRLLNHGPTVLVSAAHDGRRNVMAAAWAMPLDFDPPKIAVVIDKSCWTRKLVEASGTLALNLPTRAQVDVTNAVGNASGREHGGQFDKFAAFGLDTFPAGRIEAPLIEGCAGWLECHVLADAANQQRHDLFIVEVVAAWADARVFHDGRWHFDGTDAARRTIHHVAGGHFLVSGEALDARPLARRPSRA